MLRSSREGRKQAARYHTSTAGAGGAYSPSAAAFNDTDRYSITSIPISSFFGGRHSTTGERSRTADGIAGSSRSFTSSIPREEASDVMGAPLHASDRQGYSLAVQQPSPVKRRTDRKRTHHEEASLFGTLDAAAAPSESLDDAADQSGTLLIPASAALASGSLAAPRSAASEETRSTSSSTNRVIMQWSRETSVASRSNADSTSISSPPSSRSPSHSAHVDQQQQHEQRHIDESVWEDVAVSPTSATGRPDDMSDGASTPRRRARYARFAPRQIDGEALITHRTPRKVSKSLRQVEAEESESVKRSRSRRKRLSLSSEPNALSSQDRKGGDAAPYSVKSEDVNTSAAWPPHTGRALSLRKRQLDLQSEDAPTESSEAADALHQVPASPSSSIRRSGPSQEKLPKHLLHRPPTALPSLDLGTSSRHMRASSFTSTLSTLSSSPSSVDLQQSMNGSASTSGGDDLRKGRLRGDAADVRRVVTRREVKPTWKRKAFLTSGLYSVEHKVDGSSQLPARTSDVSSQTGGGNSRTRSLASHPRPPAFPYPSDYGHWLLTGSRDFRLSYNIVQEIDDVRAKMSSKRKPPPYKHISTNKYVSRGKLPGEIMVCQCPPTGTCDDTCVNRQTEYLCHPKHCPCGDRCTNIQFGKRKPIKTTVQWYGERGFGLRTLEPIAKNQFIDEYRGEVISYNEMVRRVRDHYKDTGNYYFLMYDAPAGEMLDGGLKGNITRYANHSCDPNCMIQKWLVCGTDEQRAGEFQVALFASRDIAAGEELTYDYGWSAFSPKAVTSGEETAVGGSVGGEPCHCGAATCSGIMGVRKSTASVPVKSAVLQKGTDTLSKRRRKKKRQSRLKKHSAATQQAVAAGARAAAASSSASRQPSAVASPSKQIARAPAPTHSVMTTFQVPTELTQLVPVEYRSGDTITVPLHLIESLKDDLKANLTTPHGRRRWERAVAVMVDAHVRGARAVDRGRAERASTDGGDAKEDGSAVAAGTKRAAAPSVSINGLLAPAMKKRMTGGSMTGVPLMAQTAGQRRTFLGGKRVKTRPRVEQRGAQSHSAATEDAEQVPADMERKAGPSGEQSVALAQEVELIPRQASVEQNDEHDVEESAAAPARAQPPLSKLIDSNNVPIMAGKRQRKISSRYADLDDNYSEPAPARSSRASTSTVKVEDAVHAGVDADPEETPLAAADTVDESWLTADTTLDASTLLESWPSDEKKTKRKGKKGAREDEGTEEPWSLLNYPPGTQFYTRQGQPFDFAVFQRRKRGKKPTPYTMDELNTANERHRINLQRLNNLRKFK